MSEQSRRPRGRPRRDGGFAPVDRSAITQAALEITADQGFPALSMRTLAARLEVSVRALYHHVRDRQDVVNLVVERIMELQSTRDLEPGNWRESVRTLYTETRAAYRIMGRAMLISLDESLTPRQIPVSRILLAEDLLAFLVDIGLSLEQALSWRARFLTEVFGYVMLIDYRADRASPEELRAMRYPVPAAWLAANPEVSAPYSRQVLDLPDFDSDDLFNDLIERAIAEIERLLAVPRSAD